MYEKTYPSKRFNITLDFLKKHISTSETIFDLGVPNPFSKIMVENNYKVINTKGEDLDANQKALREENYDVFTGFEISPFFNALTALSKSVEKTPGA